MTQDKSLFYYGSLYHRIIDSITEKHRQKIISLVPENGFILDAGCGTGELALALNRQKQCRVIGVDLSKRMIDFASENNLSEEVSFAHGDITNLADFNDGTFDFASVCMVLHELTAATRIDAVRELGRVAAKVIILDYHSPLPKNGPGLVSRLIEATLGRDHHNNFKEYLAAKGLPTILNDANLDAQTDYQDTFNNGCHQVVILSR